MGDHDAVSAVIGPVSPSRPLPPAKLIEQFCDPAAAAGFARAHPARPDGDGRMIARGFCGFNGRTGFDDGYDFMGHLQDGGWTALPGKGDWPFVVYMRWRSRGENEPHAIAEYCEADLTVWTFESPDGLRSLYAGLGDCP